MSDPFIIDAHVFLGREHYLQLGAAELVRRMDEHDVIIAIARPTGGDVAVYNSNGNDDVLSSGPRIRGTASGPSRN